MLIKGLQKLTLLDFPEKMACTVFTPGCNFRCPFCHNASLVLGGDNKLISETEFFDFLFSRKNILNGVCITGGEPTLQSDLENFLIKIKDMGFLIKLDTNGYKPEALISLSEKGLVDYVAMDIKNSPEKYGETVGLKDFDISPILKSISFLLSGNIPYEFRTTVVRELHTLQDIENLCRVIEGADNYYLQGFEDSGDLICENLSAHNRETMEKMVKIASKYVKNAVLRGF